MAKMRLGIMCSGNGTNFENIVTNPVCNKHEVVLMMGLDLLVQKPSLMRMDGDREHLSLIENALD